MTIGIAILRYRLYDIDRLIRRTLVYGLLTALLAAVYTSLVPEPGATVWGHRCRAAELGRGRRHPSGRGLFQPVRRRIQQAVDRRFNRRRYDTTTTIEAFSARLPHHVDLDALSAELLEVVDQTMEPTKASLWLRRSTE